MKDIIPFEETEQCQIAGENPLFAELIMSYFTLAETAEEELLLPEEPDEGNTEYKLKFDKPTMGRV